MAKWAMLVLSTSERVCIDLLERLTGAPPALQRHGKLYDFCYLVDHLKGSLQKVVEMLNPTARFPPSLAQLLVETALMVDKAEGRRPWKRPSEEGDDSDPGLATQRERDLTATKRGTLEPAWVAHKTEGRPKDPSD